MVKGVKGSEWPETPDKKQPPNSGVFPRKRYMSPEPRAVYRPSCSPFAGYFTGIVINLLGPVKRYYTIFQAPSGFARSMKASRSKFS